MHQLTGITQEDVNAAVPLEAVLAKFDEWLAEQKLKSALEQGTALFVAHGGWDLQDQLPLEAKRKGIALETYWNARRPEGRLLADVSGGAGFEPAANARVPWSRPCRSPPLRHR